MSFAWLLNCFTSFASKRGFWGVEPGMWRPGEYHFGSWEEIGPKAELKAHMLSMIMPVEDKFAS